MKKNKILVGAIYSTEDGTDKISISTAAMYVGENTLAQAIAEQSSRWLDDTLEFNGSVRLIWRTAK